MPEEEWEADVRTGKAAGNFFKPPEGEFAVVIKGKITRQQRFGRLTAVIPTDKGEWATNSFAVLRAIKEFKQKKGAYIGHSFTFSASGQSLARRYTFVSAK